MYNLLFYIYSKKIDFFNIYLCIYILSTLILYFKMKRTSFVHFGPINKKKKTPTSISTQKVMNEQHKNYDSDDSSDDDCPSKLATLFKDANSTIYLKQNHLYFHDEVTQKNVDSVKKLMREYLDKYNKTKNKTTFGTFTPKALFLHIYSLGGEIHAGLTLYDFIIEFSKSIPVHTVVEGIAASAATLISIAGVKRYITPNSYMLIHQLSTFFGGNFEQMKDEFGNCEKIMKQLKDIYAQRTKLNRSQLNDILKQDINWNADDCKKYGLIDQIKLIDIFNDDEA